MAFRTDRESVEELKGLTRYSGDGDVEQLAQQLNAFQLHQEMQAQHQKMQVEAENARLRAEGSWPRPRFFGGNGEEMGSVL
eukprot:588195-Amphidinium_carterae.1